MDTEPMDPSAVRARVLAEHQDIRARLERFRALAGQAPADVDAADALRRELLAFLPRLEAHMELEDDILVPALEQADAFGDVRSDMLHEHHDHYRQELGRMQADLADPATPVSRLVQWAERLVADLHAEMTDEEKTLLRRDILRDDLITTGLDG